MRFLFLILILFSVKNAQCQYFLVKKHAFWKNYSGESACLNMGRDSLTLVLREDRMTIPIETVRFLEFREHKSWRPYLLAAGFVGASTYTYFHFTSQDDAWFTAEGKARFGGFFWAGMTLFLGAMIKPVVETHILFDPRLGRDNFGGLLVCTF